MKNLHPVAQAILGGVAAALLVASPLVDDGVAASEAIAIASAFLSGSGLTALKPNSREAQEIDSDPEFS